MPEIKVLTLIQPWATLIGLKMIETRSWPTKYRGELFIHASKKIDRDACARFYKELIGLGYNSPDELPTGQIITKCNLWDCLKINTHYSIGRAYTMLGGGLIDLPIPVSPKEQQFGDYTNGRYGWMLRDITKVHDPLPAKGQLSIWRLDVPADWLEKVRARHEKC